MFEECCKCIMGISREIQGCFNYLLRFQGCFRVPDVLWGFQGCFKDVSKAFQEFFESFSRKMDGCFKEVSEVF